MSLRSRDRRLTKDGRKTACNIIAECDILYTEQEEGESMRTTICHFLVRPPFRAAMALMLAAVLLVGCPTFYNLGLGGCVILHKDVPESSLNYLVGLSPAAWAVWPPRFDIQVAVDNYIIYARSAPSESTKFLPGGSLYGTKITVSAGDFSQDWEGYVVIWWKNSVIPTRLRVLIQGPQMADSYVLPIIKESLTDNVRVSEAVPAADSGIALLVHTRGPDYLMRFDTTGLKSWQQQFTVVQGSYRRLFNVGQSGFIFARGFYIEEDGSDFLLDATLLDLQGNIVWTKATEIPGTISSAAGTPDGVVIASSPSDDTCVLQQFDTAGEEVWQLPFNGFARAICADKDGATVVFEDVTTHINICVVSPDGQLVQRNALPNSYPNILMQVCAADDGRIAVSGSRVDKRLPSKMFIIMERDGTLVWRKDFDSAEAHSLEAFTPCADGGYLLVGWGRQQAPELFARKSYVKILQKIGPKGESEWQRNAEGGNIDVVTQAPDGGYLLAGEINDQYWLYKTDAQGHSLAEID